MPVPGRRAAVVGGSLTGLCAGLALARLAARSAAGQPKSKVLVEAHLGQQVTDLLLRALGCSAQGTGAS